MKEALKHIVIIVTALFIYSNSLYASVSTKALSNMPFLSIVDSNFNGFHSESQKENDYSNHNSSGSQFVKNEFISENEEDKTEESTTKKISSQTNVLCFFHKLQLNISLPLAEGCTSAFYPTFFQSKTASSLYLIFEVFRI